MTIFGAPLQELTLDHLRHFMAEAEDEPLEWEAKATDITAGHVRKQVCGFANSHGGGYLILGADRPHPGQSWDVPGYSFPTEPTLWISNVIRQEGVRPIPAYDTRPIRVDGDRFLTVTRVDPISTPPCNARGTVYERVSGETLSVRDPQRLAELFARGEFARRTAEERSVSAAIGVFDHARQIRFNIPPESADSAVGVACTGIEPDISSRLFTEEFDKRLRTAIDTLFPHLGGVTGPWVPQSDVSQVAMTAWRAGSHSHDRSVVIRAGWDGAVGVYVLRTVSDTSPALMTSQHIGPSLLAALELEAALGAFGEGHMTVFVPPRLFGASETDAASYGLIRVSRGPAPIGSLTDHLQSIERELERAAGLRSLEG